MRACSRARFTARIQKRALEITSAQKVNGSIGQEISFPSPVPSPSHFYPRRNALVCISGDFLIINIGPNWNLYRHRSCYTYAHTKDTRVLDTQRTPQVLHAVVSLRFPTRLDDVSNAFGVGENKT